MDKNTTLLILLTAFCLSGCYLGVPRIQEVNGTTRVYTTEYFCGIPLGTETEDFKTPKQAKADADAKAYTDRQEALAKRESIAVWYGAALFGLAIVCAFIGYLFKGWKRWGGLAALSMALGGLCWGFAEWIEHLKWGPLVVGVGALIMLLYDQRDFDLKEWIAKRRHKDD